MDSSLLSTMVGQMSELYEIEVKSSLFSYPILSNLKKFISSDKRNVIIYDKNVKQRCLELFPSQAFYVEIEILEEKKNLESVQNVLASMAAYGVTRNDQIIAVGGGALQDLVTLAASVYMRGIDWHYVPTTLMSMLDSCIGGKSSINLGEYKNLVGNFYPPKSILIDPIFLSTLDIVDIAAGLAEGVKICFALDNEKFLRFQKCIDNWKSKGYGEDILKAIFLSLESKKWFVEVDEFDKKERKLLNFGHSFGHALESASGYALPHGIAVFVGMYAAILRSDSSDACKELSDYILSEVQVVNSAIPKFQLNSKKFIEAMMRDKKNSETQQLLILPSNNGKLVESYFEITSENLEFCLKAILISLNTLGFNYEVL
jgi:3-dehydroquinate synthase